MILRDQLKEDVKKAMISKAEEELVTLRLLQSAMFNTEKDRRYALKKEQADLSDAELDEKSFLTNDEFMKLVFSETKKRKESIVDYQKGGRDDLVQKEQSEIDILSRYLPVQASEEEVRKVVEDVIAETGASDIKGMGQVMGSVMSKLQGRASGDVVGKIARELLS